MIFEDEKKKKEEKRENEKESCPMCSIDEELIERLKKETEKEEKE